MHNSWTNSYYHTPEGKILGSIVLYGDKYKAMIDNLFIGWFISEDHAKVAVESAHKDSILNVPTKRMLDKYVGETYARSN